MSTQQTESMLLAHEGSAVVRFAGRRWFLRLGQELTFGRSPDWDIRFAYDPEDDWVSREAGTLIGQHGRSSPLG